MTEAWDGPGGERGTHAPIHLILLRLALLLDHQQCMVKQKHQQLRTVPLPASTALLQRALVHQLAALLRQTQVLRTLVLA